MKKKLKDKKVVIYKPINTAPRGYAPRVEYFPIHPGKAWAYVRQLSGSEFFSARAVNYTETILFTVNYHEAIEAGVAVGYKGKIYAINRVDTFEGYKDDLNLYGDLANPQPPSECVHEYGDAEAMGVNVMVAKIAVEKIDT